MRFVLDRLEDIVAAVVTAGIGVFILIEASNYSMGELRRMGPGYFPTIIGIVMIGLAALMLLTSEPTETRLEMDRGQLRGMILVAAAFAAFALTIESLGMVVAVSLAVFLSALSNRRTTLMTALALTVGTAIACVLIFRVGLGLQIEAF